MFRMLNSLLTGNSVSLFTTDFEVLPYKSYEIALFLILAGICGVLGALFVKLYRTIVSVKMSIMEKHLFSRWSATRKFEPFLYAAFVALVFALVEFPVGSFMQLSQRQLIDDMFSTGNLTSSDPTHLCTCCDGIECLAGLPARFFISDTVAIKTGCCCGVSQRRTLGSSGRLRHSRSTSSRTSACASSRRR